MKHLLKIVYIGIISIALIEDGYAKYQNGTSISKEADILIVKNSIGISSWDISKNKKSRSDDSNIITPKNNDKIESWDIWENGDTNLDGYLWIINIKSGPYITEEKAKQAAIELSDVTSNTINIPKKDLLTSQTIKSTDKVNLNKEKFSWEVNLKLGSYKSKKDAQKIVHKLKAGQVSYKNIVISREPIDIKELKSKENSPSRIMGEIFLTRNKESVKNKYSVLISTKGNSLNVREEPSTSSPIVSKLPNGIIVRYIKERKHEKNHDLWFYVQYSKEEFGWVHSNYSKKIIDSSNSVNQKNNLNSTSQQIAQINTGSGKKSLNQEKKSTALIKNPSDQVKAGPPHPKPEKTTKLIELKPTREINIKRITDLQKLNANLRIENERNFQEITDLKRSNTILRMEKEYNTNHLLELKATTAIIQTELDKIKSDYNYLKSKSPTSTKNPKFKNKVNAKELLTLQNTNTALRLENEEKTKQIASLHKSISTLQMQIDLKNKTIDSSKLKAEKIKSTNKSTSISPSLEIKENPSPKKAIDTQNIIKPYLMNWVKAWEGRNITLYMSFYSKNFKDQKRSYSQWKAHRRLSLSKSKNISIKITELKTNLLKNKSIQVTFVQRYISEITSDIGVKKLIWVKEGKSWKIVKETWQPQ